MFFVATPHEPDGTQRTAPNGDPLVFERPANHQNGAGRAILSAKKAWWPHGPDAKRISDPSYGLPPIGATIRLDGVPSFRFELVEKVETDAAGRVVDAKMVGEWVNIAEQEREAARRARVEAYNARQAALRAEAAVTAPVAAGSAASASPEAIAPAPTSRRRG
jgi:hypothetical protein